MIAPFTAVLRGQLPERYRSAESQLLLLAAGVALGVAPAVVRTDADPDLWGHLRFGLDILHTRTLPQIDPYSFTQDTPWINHEWLSELIMAAAYEAAGAPGLVLLKLTVVVAVAASVLAAYRETPLPVRGAVTLFVLAAAAPIIATVRPQLWTLLGVTMLCRFFMMDPPRYALFAIPTLFMLWANLHGGWVVGAGLLAVWTTTQLLRPHAGRTRIAAIASLSAVATLVNPYGYGLWLFLARTVSPSREIVEWYPLWAFGIRDWLPWIVVVLLVLAALFSSVRPRFDHLVMIAMMAWASLRVVRIVPLFVMVAILLLRPTISTWVRNEPPRLTPLTPTAARGLLAAILCVAIVSGTVAANTLKCIRIDADSRWVPDVEAGTILASNGLQGKIVTWFDWGQYALWHLSPRLRVSLDGRRETIYSAERLAAHFALYQATPEGIAFFQQLDPHYVWLPNSRTALRDWLVTHGYRIDLQTERSFVAARTDRARIRFFEAPRFQPCFPG